MLKVGVGLLAIGALACITSTSASAQSRSDIRNCRYITSANAARCCAVIRPFNVDACERRARSVRRGSEFAPFRGRGGSVSSSGNTSSSSSSSSGNDGLNPAGNASRGGGHGITSPNFGGTHHASPQGGATGNPGLGQGGGAAGPPGQNK